MDLTQQVNKILTEYASEVDKVVLEAEEEVAKEAVKKLKQTSPKNPHGKGKHYADSWTIDNQSKKKYAKFIIKNKQYQLTHLLENGHDIIRNGKKVGHYKGVKHIKPVEEWCQKEVPNKIEVKL